MVGGKEGRNGEGQTAHMCKVCLDSVNLIPMRIIRLSIKPNVLWQGIDKLFGDWDHIAIVSPPGISAIPNTMHSVQLF